MTRCSCIVWHQHGAVDMSLGLLQSPDNLGLDAQVVPPGGRLGWSAVYMFSHMEEAGEYPHVCLTTATGTQVRLVQSLGQALVVLGAGVRTSALAGRR